MTPPLLWKWLALAVSVVFSLFVLFLIALALPSRSQALHPLEIDLLEQGAAHGVSFACPPEGDLPNYVHEKVFTIGGEERQVLFMHPPATAAYRLQVPRDSSLRFDMAIEPEAWDKPGDGVDFHVRIKYWDPQVGINREQILYSQYLNPRTDPTARRWVEASVDLRPFQEAPAEIVFQTLAHDSAEFDWAGWSGLRIVRR